MPFSAAGIFKSNLSSVPAKDNNNLSESHGDKEGFEAALGCGVLDSQKLYADIETKSLARCAETLGIETIIVPAF